MTWILVPSLPPLKPMLPASFRCAAKKYYQRVSELSSELQTGVLVNIDLDRSRVRLLPIKRNLPGWASDRLSGFKEVF